jgi:2-oxoglutarate ferredoxin oxidoreductase subunit alpha
MKPAVLTGEHFFNGDAACAEGAIVAGCRFFAGYPITPATEIAEHLARRLPEVGGVFIQMEDEIAAMAAVLGASCAGAKSMTATSGPGFSLMMENLGLGIVMETPCVVVDVQRAGPSTGLPTQCGQGDMMQARWGSHGHYETIALAPASPQEFFQITVTAFNLSETYRLPVLIMADEVVGHLSERVVIPDPSQMRLQSRPRPKGRKDRFRPFRPSLNGVAPMAHAGEGYNVHFTGLTHDDRGYPAMNTQAHAEMVSRLTEKITGNLDKIISVQRYRLEDAEVALISYGISSRSSFAAVDEARELGIKAGLLRLVTVWPFPDDAIRELAKQVKCLITVELNLGQIHLEVQRCAGGMAPVFLVGHAGGTILTPARILETILDFQNRI